MIIAIQKILELNQQMRGIIFSGEMSADQKLIRIRRCQEKQKKSIQELEKLYSEQIGQD